jgi:hypothetical protein
MKYLKKYENFDDELNKESYLYNQQTNKYWKVKMSQFKESFYKIANLYKLDITEKYINDSERNLEIHFVKDFVYISYNKYIKFTDLLNPDPWGYARCDSGGEIYLSKNGYTYMGEIEITPDDIQKYNIWKKGKKYNILFEKF